jgi:DNA-binding transcriptional MerR regulator
VGEERTWRVGELATAAGLTVRALHHFDEIGLVRPAARSSAGHRLYTAADVRRLYRVVALRQLGVPLAEIGEALDGGVHDVEHAVRAQLHQVDDHLVRLRDLRHRLHALLRARAGTGEPTIDQLLQTMEAMMAASYFTPDQLARLRERHREAGDAGFARWQARWAELAAEVRSHVDAGRDPADPAVQRTAGEWAALMDRMTGGDRGIMSAMYARIDGKGPEAATRGIVTAEVWEYMKRAFAVGFPSSVGSRD